VLALQSDVAQSIARKVEVTVTGKEHERLTIARPISPEVSEKLFERQICPGLKATIEPRRKRALLTSMRPSGEIRRLHRVTWAGRRLFGAQHRVYRWCSQKERPKAILAARKALELDPELVGDARAARQHGAGTLALGGSPRLSIGRGTGIEPKQCGGLFAVAYWLVSQGRTEEAVTTCRRARAHQARPRGVFNESLMTLRTHWSDVTRASQGLRDTRSAPRRSISLKLDQTIRVSRRDYSSNFPAVLTQRALGTQRVPNPKSSALSSSSVLKNQTPDRDPA